MSSYADVKDAPTSNDEAAWWYKEGGGTRGPVSSADLGRLFGTGGVNAATLVWREAFGGHWKRFDEAGIQSRAIPPAAPPDGYGRWTKTFAKLEAEPKARLWSFRGYFLGPIAYFTLGMWTRGVVMAVAYLTGALVITMIQIWFDLTASRFPFFFLNFICALRLSRDYYRFRVMGERVWPSLEKAGDPLAWGAAAAALLVLVIALRLANPADALLRDVSGVWQEEASGANVVVDAAGQWETVIINGVSHSVSCDHIDVDHDLVACTEPVSDKVISLQKRWNEDHTTYTLDLRFKGLLANLVYVKPL